VFDPLLSPQELADRSLSGRFQAGEDIMLLIRERFHAAYSPGHV
jgi:hypothetical protein